MSGFYVYALVDPCDGSVFYIGKGKGKRYAAHEAEARKGQCSNGRKLERLSAIMARGDKVRADCIACELGEPSAYALERALIRAIGRERLSNLFAGQETEQQKDQAFARHELTRIIPFEDWKRLRNPTPAEEALYHAVVAGFEDVASGRWQREVTVINGRAA